MLNKIIFNIQFFTRIPVPININMQKEDYGKSLAFAPISGLLIGLLLHFSYLLLNIIIPKPVISVIIVILYCLITGSLHLDGLGDTFDGLFSLKPKEKILQIMRDSHMGTYGILSIVLILILNISIINSVDVINSRILLLFPICGKVAMAISAGSSNYAGGDTGLARNFVLYAGIKEIIISTIIFIIPITLIIGINGLILGLGFIAFAFLFSRIISQKLNGVTGDILGAICEISQSVFMLCLYVGKLFFYYS